ncbi:MAG: hypothetical protein ABI683_00740 [Ginsengibacter sp.]
MPKFEMPETMKNVEDQISDINKKLQQLVKKYAALQKENSMMSNELNEYRNKEKAQNDRLNLLEMQTSILKASAGNMSNEEKRNFEKEINQYIKYLEKCMTMLNK